MKIVYELRHLEGVKSCFGVANQIIQPYLFNNNKKVKDSFSTNTQQCRNDDCASAVLFSLYFHFQKMDECSVGDIVSSLYTISVLLSDPSCCPIVE